ncbi:MAG: glycoside hydrolase family 13 protein [Pirellulales bacterium]
MLGVKLAQVKLASVWVVACQMAWAWPAAGWAQGGGAEGRVPGWAADAVFYQIFPERFRNGDSHNDPTRPSLEFPDVVPENWRVSTWTGDWYSRPDWEQQMGNRFYEDGVFHRRYGGDLQGVIDKLDYLQQLGVNTLYFNPVFYARSLHKYDGNSFHHVDPYFGPDPEGDLALMSSETSDPETWKWTAADKLFLQLVSDAHRREMRVIIDGVFNHTGRDFFAFADLRARQQASTYKDWYVVERYDDPSTPANEFRYKGWWGVDTLPEFADSVDGTDLHPGPKAYIFAATRRWMDPDGDRDTPDGIDGWRLDVANEVPLKFWREWNAVVRECNPEAYTVTEIWQDATSFLRDGGFSATMNYHGFAFLVKGFLIDGTMPPSRFEAEYKTRHEGYPEEVRFAMQNLVDSHDTDRLASMIVNAGRAYQREDRFDYDVGERVSPRHDSTYKVQAPDSSHRKVQRLVALLQMTAMGAPMIYYGTEAGMWGGDDPDDRMPMVWPDLQYEPQAADPLSRPRTADAVAFDQGLYDYYRAAVALRHRVPALRRGSWQTIATDDQAQGLAFLRQLDDSWAVTVINRGQEPWNLEIPCGKLPPNTSEGLRVELVTDGTPDSIQVSGPEKDTIRIAVPGLTGAVLVPEARSDR